jgi:predicted acylesterase/phospholipase RssA
MGQRCQTALVLQGGGAIGAYHLGVVQRLYAAGLAPEIVTGVSIGAITAAVLVGARRDDPVAELGAVWDEFTVGMPFLGPHAERAISSLTNFGLYRPRYDIWAAPSWTAMLSTDPLRSTLVRHVDFNKLNESATAFAISAVDVESGEIECFRNRGGNYVALDDIVASGSLPPGFPMTEIDGKSYWDGGLFDCTPLQPALDFFDPDPELRRRLIVVAPMPRLGRVPGNFNEVAERMIELQFSSRMRSEIARVRHHNALVELMAGLDAERRAALAAASPEFRRADTGTLVHEIVVISNEEPGIATGASDFSASAIARRVKAGAADAEACARALETAA